MTTDHEPKPGLDASLRVTTRLGVGAVIVAVGLAFVGTGKSDAGGLLLLVGWVLVGASLHAFGRHESHVTPPGPP